VRKLKQVVINLLSNAVKFTPAGGRVTLRARKLEHAVEIAVVDTGVGIAADQQALVFEEFRQAGGDYLRKSEGTGLGLLAREALRRAARRDDPGRERAGSRLDLRRLSFPSGCWRRYEQILIVEDNEKNMKLVRDILRHNGHATVEAVNGLDGVRLALEAPPDLVLMDIQLPDIDGIEALRRIREVPALDAVPVIAVSASVMPDDHQKIVRSGFDAFVTKPINLKSFLDTVQRALSQRRQGRQG
jgi:two-component system cell cycle response regulator DivK